MGKRTTILLGSFILVMIFNVSVINYLVNTHSRSQKQAQVLAAIDEIDPLNRQFAFSASPLAEGTYEDTTEAVDARAVNLKSFFRKYNSPLYDHAEYIVETSDRYGFDYRLLPAIAMQESGLCRVIPYDSYNCWGWGIYGNTVTRFGSYEEAIDTVARGLKKNYIDKGLITASAIMEKYTPSSNGSWAHGVNTFLHAVENH